MIPDVYLQQVFQAHSCSLLKRSASPRIPCRLPFHRNDDEDDDNEDDDNVDDDNDDDDGGFKDYDEDDDEDYDEDDGEDYDEDDNEDDIKDGTHCGSPVAPCSSSLFPPTTSLLKHDIISKL